MARTHTSLTFPPHTHTPHQVTIDALLPPWNKRTRIAVTLKGSVDIGTLLTFISKVQGGAAALLAGAAEPAQDGVVSLVD